MAPKPGYLRRILERFEEIVGVGGVKVDGQVEAVLTGSLMELYVNDEAELPAADSVPLGAAAQLVGTDTIWQSNGTDWVVLS